jgi:hypothetical protein
MIPLGLHRRTLMLNCMRSGKTDAVLAILAAMQGSRQSSSDASDAENRPIDFLSADGTVSVKGLF